MAEITEITQNDKLLEELKDFINDPKFNPKHQDKYFFSTGMSYYQQLCSVLRMLDDFSKAFKIVWENEKIIATSSVTEEKLIIAVATLKAEIEEEISALETSTDTKFNSVNTLLLNHTAELESLRNALNIKIRGVEITGVGIGVADRGVVDGIQKITLTNEGGGGGSGLTQNLSYANANVSPLTTELHNFSTNDSDNILVNTVNVDVVRNGSLAEEGVNVGYYSKNDFKRGTSGELEIKEKGINAVGTSGNVELTVTTDESTGNRVLNASVNTSQFATADSVTAVSNRTTTLEGQMATANSNISSLQTETSALDSRIDVTDGNVSALGRRMTTAEGNIVTNQGKIASALVQIEDLSQEIEQIHPEELVKQSFEETEQGTPYKPQSPLKKGDDYFYPLTHISQVIKNDESRLSEDDFGIKKMFIDTSRLLSSGRYYGSAFDYTATEECYVCIITVGSVNSLGIDGVSLTSNVAHGGSVMIPIKKGTRIYSQTSGDSYVYVYGLK